MTRYFTLISLILHSLLFSQGKVSGIISDKIGPLPGINVKISDSISTITDFDGKYELSIFENKKINLLFEAYIDLVTIEITQIDAEKLTKSKLNIVLPSHDLISAKNYESLTEKEKLRYNPLRIVTYGSIQDRYASKEFKEKFVIIYLNDREIKIVNFKYDEEKGRVIINGNELW